MDAQQAQQPLNMPRSNTVGRTYFVVLSLVLVIGVALSAFDSIARNVSLPLMLKDLNMSITFGSAVFSIGFLVTFVVNLLLGRLMDRWGRKNTFLLSLVLTALFSGLTAFITQSWQFAVTGSLASVAISVLPCAQVLAGEEMPAKVRGLMTGILTGSFSFGAVVVGLVGSVVLPTGNWRLLFLIAFTPIIIAVVGMLVLRESVRSQELQLLRKEGEKASSQVTHRVDLEKMRRSEWQQIFASDLRRQTIVLMIGGFLLNFSTGLILTLGVTFFVAYDHLTIGQASLAITVDSAMAILGGIIWGTLGDRIPARNVLIVFSLVGAVAVMALAISGGVGLVFAAMAVFGFCGQGVIACWFRYVAESFPTRARGTGMLFVEGTFFLGLVIAPTLFGSLMNTGNFAATALVAGGIAFVGALVLLGGNVIQPQKELEDIHI